MTRNDITLSLMRAGLYSGQWTLDDVAYDTVSADFVAEAAAEFPSFLPPELRTMRDIGGGKMVVAPRWLEESFDCDNIARAFGVYLDICMARDAVLTKRTRGNIAAGKLNFAPTPTTGHAVNWFIDHEGNAQLIDAANPMPLVLTEAQRQSISAGETI